MVETEPPNVEKPNKLDKNSLFFAGAVVVLSVGLDIGKVTCLAEGIIKTLLDLIR